MSGGATSAAPAVRSPTPTPPTAAAPGVEDEATRRRQLRRFGLGLAAVVAVLVLFAVAYVTLFDRVLADPTRPPTATSRPNPRVLIFEVLLAAALAVGATTWWVRRKGRST